MRLLLLFPKTLRAPLTIGHMDGWTHSCQEGWLLHLLMRPHHPLTDEVSATSLLFIALAAPDVSRRYIVGLKRGSVVGRVECNI